MDSDRTDDQKLGPAKSYGHISKEPTLDQDINVVNKTAPITMIDKKTPR